MALQVFMSVHLNCINLQISKVVLLCNNRSIHHCFHLGGKKKQTKNTFDILLSWAHPGWWTHKCPSNINLLWNKQWSRCSNYEHIVRQEMNAGQRLITTGHSGASSRRLLCVRLLSGPWCSCHGHCMQRHHSVTAEKRGLMKGLYELITVPIGPGFPDSNELILKKYKEFHFLDIRYLILPEWKWRFIYISLSWWSMSLESQ